MVKSCATSDSRDAPPSPRRRSRQSQENTVSSVSDFQSCLKAHATATAALTAWCRARRPAAAMSIVVACDGPAPSDAYRGPLALGPGETLQCRRVRLAWGETVISEAENWYVPQRLPPSLRAALAHGTTPFGAVVEPLSPSRRTIALFTTEDLRRDKAAADRCGAQLDTAGFSPLDAFVLHLDAVMSAGGADVAELREHYRRELLEM